MKEYKIVKPESMWAYKDATFEQIFNQHASQGWRVKRYRCIVDSCYIIYFHEIKN